MSFTYTLSALPWDLVIFLLIITGGVLVFVMQKERLPWGRHLPFVSTLSRKIRLYASVLGIALSLTVFYGSFIEPQIITITEEEIDLPAEEDLTIVVLADFHVGPYKGRKFVQRVVNRVKAINPDLVFLVGDFVYLGGNPLDHLVPLEELAPRYGIYAVLGNHEYSCYRGNIFSNNRVIGFDQSSRVKRALERMGVQVLSNSWVETQMDSDPLYIGGVDDMCSNRDNLPMALPKNNRKAPVILLSHDPSIILDNQATYPHLIVSGHTHGGQARIPFVGPITKLPTQLGRKYDQGIFAVDKNTTLAITRGVGESGARARFFAPPEIMVLRSRMAL